VRKKENNYECKVPRVVISLLLSPCSQADVTQAQTGTMADVVAAITNLENDGVKADLAGDAAFYQKVLAEDWTRAIAMEPITAKPNS